MDTNSILRRTVADRFTDSVFSWSIGDIFNDDLFKSKVEKIPETFQSVDQYFKLFVNPLLEEIRAELHSAMETLHQVPFAQITKIEQDKQQLFYNIEVDSWEKKSCNGGGQKEPYKTLPGDLFVVAQGKPERVSDLQKPGKPWAFLSIVDMRGENNTTKFKAKASKDFDPKSPMFVVFLINLIPSKRIWESLHMHSNLTLIEKVLQTDYAGKKKCNDCLNSYKSNKEDTLKKISPSNLNDSQTAAVISCLHMLDCERNSAFELIWGPPGTGKTKTISTLLVALLARNCKTLVCAPTNVAITEVASRVVKMVSESNGSLGDILLFGTKERLNIGSDVEAVYLEHRVEELTECFGPLGWKKWFNSMIDFLENCVSQYRVKLENEAIKERDQKDYNKIKSISFLEHFRKSFDSIFTKLKHCVNIICTHAPESCITKENVRNMNCVVEFLSSFQSMLLQTDLVSNTMEEAFSHSEANEDLTIAETYRSLYIKKKRCLCTLIPVRDCLNELNFPSFNNKQKTKNFCYESASLIFCTVSCSATLLKTKFKPTVLVIDEAAQLKESESTIPLQLKGLKHAILVGDECQLPSTVKSKVSIDANFERSLFGRLSSQNYPKHLLSVQYRMHPSISRFPNSKFYDNKIRDAEIVKQRMCLNEYLPVPMFGPYSFINIIGGKDEKDEHSHSRKNIVEIAVIDKIVDNLYRDCRKSKSKLRIGIVSPYAAQVSAIQHKLQRYDKMNEFQVKIKTVDGFQGGEEDIIIMSTVCSGQSCPSKFLSMPQRVNVALTRARQHLWILGDVKTLRRQALWHDIISDAGNRGCLFDAESNKDLAKAITDTKKKFGQFNDLLDPNAHLHLKDRKWKVFLSDKFMRSVHKLPIGGKTKVKNLLIELSKGQRPPGRIIMEYHGSSNLLIEITNFKVVTLCVVTTVDIAQTSTGYEQVLRIWDLLHPDNLSQLAQNLASLFEKYNDDYTTRCNAKPLFEGKLEIPQSWSGSFEVVRFKELARTSDSSEKACVESLLGMNFYSLSNCVLNHMLSNRDARELDLLFQIPDQQKEIILHQRSGFILGRSGTGKTSVLTMKLFQNEYLHGLGEEGLHGLENGGFKHVDPNQMVEIKPVDTKRKVLRQIFVTSSPELCSLAKKNLAFMRRSGYYGYVNEIDYEEIELKKDPSSFCGISTSSYPLILTYRQFLIMLDGSLNKSLSSGSQLGQQSSTSDLIEFMKAKEVNRERFRLQYWPLFDRCLVKKLDPSTVFTEIISHIKGGARSLEAGDGKISKEDYITMSKDLGHGFSKKRREMIYDLFQVYEEMKIENGEFDIADFVNDLHVRLKHESYKGDKMDFVYADEVQSLTMSQFSLFSHICGNHENGFVFSGDSLKTNASNSAFRIQDMRSLFDKSFVSKHKEKKKDKSTAQTTNMFHLTQNFQAHSGNLKLSQSLIELLYHFFPMAMDIVEPETTIVNGEPPVLLQCCSNEDALAKLFSDGSSGFGAKQVIIVRDETDQKKIKDLVKNRALTLTMLECQDLDFEDVLLYNFFGSSPLKKQWDVIFKYMRDHVSNEFTIFSSLGSELDNSKSNILLAELKQLYVFVSSTRHRLWILDDIGLSKPMFDYWKTKALVQVREVNDLLAREMKVSSTSEEWELQGIKLYHKHNYKMATICFVKAHSSLWEAKSKAAYLVAMANRERSLNHVEANSFLKEAAETYKDIGEADSAAKCFYDSGDYEQAGNIYMESSELCRAGECFSMAGRYKLAADNYAKAYRFTECLKVCVKGKLFDVGLEYLEHWKADAALVKEEIYRIKPEFIRACVLHYYEVEDMKSMMEVLREFVTKDLTREFLKSKDCLDELLSLEESLGNFAEAAEIAKLKGDVLQLGDLLGKAGNFREASKVILSHVLASSLWSSGENGWPFKPFKGKDKLLNKAKSFAINIPLGGAFYNCVLTEVDVLDNKKRNLVTMVNEMNFSRRHESIVGEIISAWRIVDDHLASKHAKYIWREYSVLDIARHSQDVILEDRVSVESLVYFWNIWKDMIMEIFKFLGGLEVGDVDKAEKLGEFCMSFLGVWRQFEGSNAIYIMLNSDACWARNVEKKHYQSNRKLFFIDSKQFESAAQSYWSSEVLGVGFKVLRKLLALYSNTTPKVDLASSKCRTLILIHEVAKFLSGSEFLKRTSEDSEGLQKFVTLSVVDFCGLMSPLDPRTEFSENLYSFRETDHCKDYLKRVIVEYINPKNNMSHGKIGSIAMAVLGSGHLGKEMFEEVLGRLDQKLPWKAFFEALSRSGGSHLPSQDLIFTCQKALSNAYEERLEFNGECISPECFVYLTERLVIWVSSFKGHFVTLRSSFVEWLIYEKISDIGRSTNSDANLTMDFQVSLLGVLRFVIDVIQMCLLNKEHMIEWIGRWRKKPDKGYYSSLVTRMVVIVCLIHANFGLYLDLLSDLLIQNHISEHLPPGFVDAIKSQFMRSSLDALAKAFQKLGNLLVIVSFGDDFLKKSLPGGGIVVDVMKIKRCKKDIIKALLPKRVEASEGSLRHSTKEASETTSTMYCESFWKIFERINFDENKFAYSAHTMMVDVEKQIRHITSALNSVTLDFEVKQSSSEMRDMVEEMKSLSIGLGRRQPFMVEEALKKLKLRRPRLDCILNKLLSQNTVNHNNQTQTGACESARTTSFSNIAKSNYANESAAPVKNEKKGCYIQ